MAHAVFVTGGTGYIGSRLIRMLVDRGHRVRALARPGSVARLPRGCAPVEGNALDASTFASRVVGCDTFVHLVGTPHPSPSKAEEFRRVDLVSVRESVQAAAQAGVAHFVYVSVAHPAPAMHAYIEVRTQGEATIRERGLTATILRPWYVLGPGHRWPMLLVPFYAVCELIPSTRETAKRLGLVTIGQMVGALVRAVEEPPANGEVRVVGVEGIRTRATRPLANYSRALTG